jgi:hypothetical protein
LTRTWYIEILTCSADGKRFLINVQNASGAASPLLTVVTNWTAGMKK